VPGRAGDGQARERRRLVLDVGASERRDQDDGQGRQSLLGVAACLKSLQGGSGTHQHGAKAPMDMKGHVMK
jgi:hypothetical protein